MCRTDAFIHDRMFDRQLSDYLREQDEYRAMEEQAYDDCLNACDKELTACYDKIFSTINRLSKEYGIQPKTIWDEMVLPTLESEL